jgi:hypothetical protein
MKRSRLIFFLYVIPVFCHTAFTVPFGRPFFNSYSLYPLPILASGGATGLRGTFSDHPSPFHLTFTDTHNIYTPMGVESVDSSFHHPTVSPEETYTHIHGPAKVPSLKKILPFDGIRTH